MACAYLKIGEDRLLLGVDRQRADQETAVIQRTTGRPDEVCRESLNIMQKDCRLLIPIGIELHTALLHEDTGEMLERLERISGQIGLHINSP